eukprot:CAMPEP_0195510476 /NCGR_PEP_ID=MMETSP0794_2-20130614/3110_1 /TAXON_ID=515487 /ORGANISM="Stephanopyxis turris, Strain CCMP 815" /LENGTH=258 /DNA_ID=CAMNT_0040637903 /DNA_START=36 /DNA_END=812 /DNA_ORIENTATION=-
MKLLLSASIAATCILPYCQSFLSTTPSLIKRHHTIKTRNRTSKTSSLSMGLTLYGSQGSRSPLVNWAAYELSLPIVMGDLSQNPHPFKQIPCMTSDGDVTLFESGAILLYLQSLCEDGDEAKKAAIMSWVTWANASLDPVCFLETPEGKVYDTGLKKPNRKIDTLDSILSNQKYLLGDGDDNFSTGDVAVASYLLYVPQFFPDVDLGRWPNVVRYMKDCVKRPAYGKAFGGDVQNYLVGKLDAMGAGDGGQKKLFGMF